MVPLAAHLRLLDPQQRADGHAANYGMRGFPGSGGRLNDGNPVSNVFAYDCSGKPLHNVQLFDQDGEKAVRCRHSARNTSPTTTRNVEKRSTASPTNSSPRATAGTSSRWTSTGSDPKRGRRRPGPFPCAPAVRRSPAAAERLPAPATPTVPEVLLPTTMPTAPTLDPEGVKATDAKGGESATPTASPIPGTPEPGESKAPKESAKQAAPSGKPSSEAAGRQLGERTVVGCASGLRVSRAAGAWPGTGPRPAGRRPRGSPPSAAPPGSRAAKSPIRSAGWRRLPRWSW